MAITFISHDSGDTILFGGQSSMAGADAGVFGPAATYSINREDIKTTEGSYINSKYNINITGTATLASYPADMDDRQNLSVAKQETLIVLNKLAAANGNGRLDIASYGGQGNVISFNDAKIISLDVAEQDDTNLDTQYVVFTVAFEAYRDISNSTSTGDPGVPKQPTENLLSVEETWDLSSTDQYVYKERDLKDEKDSYRKTYTLTHTITAVGAKVFDSNELNKDDGHAWKQAYNWVVKREGATEDFIDASKTPITKDLVGNTTDDVSGGDLKIRNLNRSTDSDLFDLEDYKCFNKLRSVTSNISGGSYSITDTYLYSFCPTSEDFQYKNDINASYDIEISIDEDLTGSFREVSINGTIVGFDSSSINSISYNAYNNAYAEYSKLFKKYKTDDDVADDGSYLDTFLGVALKEKFTKYEAIGTKGTLNETPTSHSESHDKINGSISFTTTFNDETSLDGIVSRTEVVNYTNYQNHEPNDGTNNNFKTDQPTVSYTLDAAPSIYFTNSTDEKKASITIDIIYDLENRKEKPDPATGTVPMVFDTNAGEPQITSDTESWNPKTGAYNRTLEYTYV